MKELIKPNLEEICYEEVKAHNETDCCFAYVCNKHCMGRESSNRASESDEDILF